MQTNIQCPGCTHRYTKMSQKMSDGDSSMKLECEVIVNKPIQQVWDYANNPDNLTNWLNDFIRYEHLTGDQSAPKIGDTSNHTYDQNGKEFTMHEEITAFDAPNHIKLFMTSSWFDMEIINNFTEISPTETIFAKKKMLADHQRQINKLKSLIEDI